MRTYIFIISTLVLFTCCKTDPNKHVDEGKIIENTYQSSEIGWTMKIPDGWEVTKRNESQRRENKGLKLLNEANDINYDASSLKQLISFQKDRVHSFTAVSEKVEIENNGEYEKNKQLVKELLYNTYASNGIKIDTASSKEKIDNLKFNLFKITVYGPQGDILLYQDLYSTFRNGLDFGVNLNYLREKEKMELMRVWKNSKFQ